MASDSEQADLGASTPAKWDAFVAHASEDKDDLVRPLAKELRSRGLRVWFDEFELKVGDSLRERIDHGLANSHHGIVVLSPDFFRKEWPKNELNGLVAREQGGRRRILPVWHRIGKSEVAEHSPILADRHAAKTDQSIADLASELIASMDVEPSEAPEPAPPPGKLALSPPPPNVRLKLLPSGASLIDALVGKHEGTFDIDDIPDDEQRTEVAAKLDEIKELSEIWDELSLSERERAKSRASELVVELLEQELLPLVGHYERKLTGPDGTSVPWPGVVVRVAPAASISQSHPSPGEQVSGAALADQKQLDDLLALLTRPSMKLIEVEDFSAPWPERIKTPLLFLVNEYDEVEHQFDDEELEQRRRRLMQAANHFLHQEAMHGFGNRHDPSLRDAGYTPGEAEGVSEREDLLDRRQQILSSAARELLAAYDDFVGTAKRRGLGSMPSRASVTLKWPALIENGNSTERLNSKPGSPLRSTPGQRAVRKQPKSVVRRNAGNHELAGKSATAANARKRLRKLKIVVSWVRFPPSPFAFCPARGRVFGRSAPTTKKR
jgi:hypothetical protein